MWVGMRPALVVCLVLAVGGTLLPTSGETKDIVIADTEPQDCLPRAESASASAKPSASPSSEPRVVPESESPSSSPTTSPSPSQSEVIPPILSPFRSTVTHNFGVHVVGSEVTFEVRMVDVLGNDITVGGNLSSVSAVAVHGGVEDIACTFEDLEDGQYAGRFTPHIAGEYSLFVYINQVPIPSSPFFLTAVADAEKISGVLSWAIGNSMRSGVAGVSNSFVVGVSDREGNEVVGGASVDAELLRHPDAISDSTTTVSVTVVETETGLYSCEYNATEAGLYSLVVHVNDHPVPGSPFVTRVVPNTVGNGNELDTAPVVDHEVLAGQEISLKMTSFDKFGNRRVTGGNIVVAQFIHVSTKRAEIARVVDNNDGTYHISIALVKSGEYQIKVTTDGILLEKSTEGLDFTVLPGPSSPDHARIEGQGVHSAIAGEPAVVILKMRDIYSNEAVAGGANVTAVITQRLPVGVTTSPRSYPVSVDDLGNGTYVLTYTVEIASEYTLRVLLAGNDNAMQDVQASPSIVTAKPALAFGQRSFVTGNHRDLAAGSTLHFSLHTADRFGNRCVVGGAEVSFELSAGTPGTSYVTNITDTHNGLYILKVTIFKAGVYVPVVRVFGSRAFTNTSVNVRHGPTSAQHSVARVTGIDTIEAGVPTTFAISTNDVYGNPTPGDDGPLTIQLNSFNDTVFGTFSNGHATITATKAGPANLTILFDRSPVINSPYTLLVIGSWTSALRTTASGPGLSKAVAGKLAHFIVVPRDQFSNPSTKGPINVEVLDSDNFVVPTQFKDLRDFYNITFLPTVTGLHTVKIAVQDEQSPGSPFSVLVEPGRTHPPACQVLGGGIAEALIGHRNEFVVVARDALGNLRGAGGDSVRVFAQSPNGGTRTLDFDVIDTGSGLYRVSYMAPQLKTSFRIFVEINGQVAGDQESFLVDVVGDVSPIECLENCNNHGICNTRTGLCSCADTYTGPSCAVRDLKCPEDCSGHGDCNRGTGLCLCHDRFSGNACECLDDECSAPPAPPAPQPKFCENDCSGHGHCVETQCSCDVGFTGPSCSLRTEYSVFTLSNGMVLLYEVATGRMFGYVVHHSEDGCVGFDIVNNQSNPHFANTSFVQRKPLQRYADVGENSVLEIDPLTSRVSLLTFKRDDVQQGVLSAPTEREIDPAEDIVNKQLVYLGVNKLLVSTSEQSDIWVIDRQDPQLLRDKLTSTTWGQQFLAGRYFFAGEDRVGKYRSNGQFDVFVYDSLEATIQVPAHASGQLGHVAYLRANSSLVVTTIDSKWLAFSPFTAEYRFFQCSDQQDSKCVILTGGSFLNGYECTPIELAGICDNLSVEECLVADECGVCGDTLTCLPGSEAGPAAGSACNGGWMFSPSQNVLA